MTTSPSPATPDKTLSRDLASGALALAIAEIAEDAARLILPYWRSDTAVETKSDDIPVTQADRAAEALILGGQPFQDQGLGRAVGLGHGAVVGLGLYSGVVAPERQDDARGVFGDLGDGQGQSAGL